VPLYLHGVPTSSGEWPRFLERSGGLAPDLPGFGRSGKPGTRSYSIDEYERFLERFLELTETGRVSLVMHDWGAVGLAFAQRFPERVARIVLINAVPFLPGYSWHRWARIWRTPVLGELAMGFTTPASVRRAKGLPVGAPEEVREAWLKLMFEHFEQGTQRAILKLYRSSPPEVLEAAGASLGRLKMPALVVWGMRDPYIPASFARDYASALQGELLEVPEAGHWPWLEAPALVDRIVEFLRAEAV